MNRDPSTCPLCSSTTLDSRWAARETIPITPAGFVSCAILGAFLGAKSARHARDWCKRHGIAVRADGKSHFVLADDIDRAIMQLPCSGKKSSSRDGSSPTSIATANKRPSRAAQALMTGKK